MHNDRPDASDAIQEYKTLYNYNTFHASQYSWFKVELYQIAGSASTSMHCMYYPLVDLCCYHFHGPSKWQQQRPIRIRCVQGILVDMDP